MEVGTPRALAPREQVFEQAGLFSVDVMVEALQLEKTETVNGQSLSFDEEARASPRRVCLRLPFSVRRDLFRGVS